MNNLLPLIGVLLGWGLKELSDLVRGEVKKKANLKQALYKLICFREELKSTFMSTSTILKYIDEESFSHEKKRKKYQNQHLNIEKIEMYVSDLEKLISDIDPFLTYKITSFINAIKSFYMLEFNAISQEKELYVEILEKHIFILYKSYYELESELKMISKKISYLEYRKIKKHLKKHNSDKLYNSDSNISNYFYPKIDEFLKKVKE